MEDPEIAELRQKAELLKASTLFQNTGDEKLLHKQNIFLVIAGRRPITEVYSSHMEQVSEDTHAARHDSPEEVAVLLDSLGLVYELETDEQAVTATVAANLATLARYTEAIGRLMQSAPGSEQETQANVEVGQLYGFPKTAAEGYAHNEKLDIKEQDRIVQEAGIPAYFAGFFFSVDHYQDELKVLQEWYALLRKYDLV